MWCDNCDALSYSIRTTITITKDGRELVTEKCAFCKSSVKVEYASVKGPAVSFRKSQK